MERFSHFWVLNPGSLGLPSGGYIFDVLRNLLFLSLCVASFLFTPLSFFLAVSAAILVVGFISLTAVVRVTTRVLAATT